MKYDDRRSASSTWTCLAAAQVLTASCATVPHVTPDALARAAVRPELPRAAISVRWLGCAGFELRTAEGVLLLDPYLTRPTPGAAAVGRLASDEELLAKVLPEATLILAGHSHFDHLLDAPAIARRTGAELAGTKTTCLVAEALQLPKAQCRAVQPGERFSRGPFRATAVASEHSRLPGLGVPFPGVLTEVPKWRWPHMSEMPMGGAIIWVIRTGGMTIVHVGAAGLPPDPGALERAVPEGADLVLASIGARENTPGYARRLIAELRPKVIIPAHFDSLFGPAGALLPPEALDDVAAFEREAAGARVERLVIFEPRTWTREELDALPRGQIEGAVGR